MDNLNSVEIKAFVPAKDFALSKQLYQDVGFVMASDGGGVAYFHHGQCSFLLQDYCPPTLADNLMLHWLVEDVAAWHQALTRKAVAATYQVKMTDIVEQPWGMREFFLYDPSGVLWRIAQNI